MPPPAASSSVLKGAWRPTKIMNMRDLSHDDDFLSHLLVEKLGTGGFPLVVHKMDPSRRLPKTDPADLMQIIRRLVALKGPSQTAIRQAVDDLLSLTAVRYYIRTYTQKQINAFATHASRYFELYLPSGSIEIAHTSRYSHRTGKSELCILATRPLAPGTVISELKGSMADLTDEEDKELKGTDLGRAEGVGIRRDFSVIHSKQLKKNHLFLGPARFVNHDCDHNVELFREGRYITFRVIKPIAVGEEVTAHYGDGYFGRNNRHCLCQTCEMNKRGGYAPHSDELSDSGSSPDGASSDNDDSDSTTDREDTLPSVSVNVNERRTRRGVYAVLPEEEDDSSDSDGEGEAGLAPAVPGSSKDTGLLTPDTDTLAADSCSASAPSTPRKATPSAGTAFIISTRAQKARAVSELESTSVSGATADKGSSRSASAVRQLETPPLTSDNGSVADGPTLRSSSRLRLRGDAASSASRVPTPMPDRKGRTPAASTHQSTADMVDLKGKAKEDPEMEGRSLRRRPTLPAPLVETASAAKKPQDGPRGVDGKLLPTCMTCKNVLPVISVEDKVVWNGAPEKTGKRGRPRKQINQECPRCMRHYAIYAVRWPERFPSDGTPAFTTTPRDHRSSTPSFLSQKNLAALNHKLSNAASTSRSASAAEQRPLKRQRTEEVDAVPSPKRQKVAPPAPPRPRGRPPKVQNKVGMSSKARELLGMNEPNERRSGRARVPSLKLRESEPPSKDRPASASKAPISSASTSTAASSSQLAPSSPLSPLNSDIHDRPHLRSTGSHPPAEPVTPDGVKTESGLKVLTPKSLAVASQPRESNGRFGKKASTNGKYMRKNFHVTAGGRRMMRIKRSQPSSPSEQCEGTTDTEFSMQKRTLQEVNGEGWERGKRRRTEEEEEEEEEEEDEEVLVQIKVEGEEGDLSMLSKEEDAGSGDEGEPHHFRRPVLMATRSGPALLSRPNPLTFARRKWISSTASEDLSEMPEATTSSNGQFSTDDDTELPVTPETELDGRVDVAEDDDLLVDDDEAEDSDDSAERVYCRPKLSMKRGFGGPFTLKPNPLNMARRRWGPSLSSAPDVAEESIDRSSSNTPSHASPVGFPELFEAEPDEVSLAADDHAHSEVSSEEEGFRGPCILSIYRPGHRSSGSERSVERLVSGSDAPLSHTDSRPGSAGSSTLPIPTSPQKSPGMAWKQIVLLPSNVPFIRSTAATDPVIPSPSPIKLTRVGWDSASDDTD